MADRKAQLKEIARIQRLKGEKQWKAAQQFALDANPKLAEEHRQHMIELEELRESLGDNRGKMLKFDVSIPVTIMEVIRKFDPDFMRWDKRSYATPDGSNKMARKLMRVFPEYRIPQE